ncbi:MAG TPA: hypothetical protein VHX38_25535 [Pseudonocardiaceae bacterium]|jgi:hypothetical protein|nr:hypothetical protein [Pseudonocardiaceae bacterium]
MSTIKKARGVAGLVGLAFGAAGAVKELREAKGKRDFLALANAIVNILAVLTGGALVIRGLRKGDDAQ